MKQLGVILLLPLDEMLTSPSQGYPQHSHKLPKQFTKNPIYMPGWRIRHCQNKVSCPRTLHNDPRKGSNLDTPIITVCHCATPSHNLIVNLIIYFTMSTQSATKQLWVWLVKIVHEILPFRQARTAGNISASTTISAKSTECFAIWLNAENMCRCKINNK